MNECPLSWRVVLKPCPHTKSATVIGDYLAVFGDYSRRVAVPFSATVGDGRRIQFRQLLPNLATNTGDYSRRIRRL